MKFRSIVNIKKISGKRVLVRVDFNVPLKGKKVADSFKIKASLPTIRLLVKKGAAVIVLSHLGRPSGYEAGLSLAPVAAELQKLLGKKIPFTFRAIRAPHDLSDIAHEVKKVKPGTVTMLDNIRFLPGEETGDRHLSRALASLGNFFVLDGFAVSHRDSASVTGIARYLPSYAGLLLSEEISVLSNVLTRPKRPLVVILGGVKVETKIPVLKRLLPKASHILVGGGIANTYWWATGKRVGSSLIGKKYEREIKRYCKNKKVILPVDVVVGGLDGVGARVVDVESLSQKIVGRSEAIYDIGPRTVRLFARYMKNARTLVWNGALGMFEEKPYRFGTLSIAQTFAARSKGTAFGVAGGGETVELLQAHKLTDAVDFVSTGGGAMLEFLSGKPLPGLKRLKKKIF